MVMMMETQRIPIVRLSGKLIVSIQTALSDTVVDRLQQDVAAACERGDARGLVVDLSGVDILDSYITRSIRDLAVMARLMGVETVVCGLRPAVAMTPARKTGYSGARFKGRGKSPLCASS